MYEREQLKNSLENLVPLVKATLGHAHSLQEQAVQFSLYDDQLEGSKGFKVTVQVPKCRKTPTNNNTTWYKECDRTCHRDCGLSNDNDKARCCVMDNGKQVPLDKAPKHSILEWSMEEQEKTRDDLKAKYDEANQGKLDKEKIMEGIRYND